MLLRLSIRIFISTEKENFLILFFEKLGENTEKDAKIKDLDGKIKVLVEKDLHNAEELKDLRVKVAKVS